MASDDADFAAYLTARWPALVRTLVLLGQDLPGAEASARAGLARCRAEWESVRRFDDVDAHVYAAVLERRGPAATRTLTALTEEDTARLQAVDERLRALPAEERERLVLAAVAGLSAAQVADILDISAGRPPSGTAEVRDAAETIAVSAAPVAEVLALARARRRRRTRLAIAAVVAVLLAGGAGWLAVRAQQEDPLPDARVTRAPNPVDVAWYADGVLHLDQVEVEVPPLTDLSELNGGAVYADEEGVVAFVAADGDRRRLGSKVADSPLVASADEGWAMWLEPGGGAGSRLVVYDVGAGEAVATHRDEDPEVRPVAIDQGLAYFDTSAAGYVWNPGAGAPEPLDRGGLADVEAATRVYQLDDGRIEMEQGVFSTSFAVPGVGALLSPGGTFVLSRPPAADPAAAYRPLIYDTRSGERLPAGIDPGERVLDATFGDNYRLAYLVAPERGTGADGRLILRTCDLDVAQCSDLATVTQADGRPLLAH